ncbi:hypothetical protein LTR64_000556 [Lithohypha guttulata]|uniref:uncharacterized protein n=1 Tax=Lithohypha guttulata TaxID=1690604 RepID=UPI002DDE911F|nr:hypothetical protein LTR51_005678 [Lithohypha guttulata]
MDFSQYHEATFDNFAQEQRDSMDANQDLFSMGSTLPSSSPEAEDRPTGKKIAATRKARSRDWPVKDPNFQYEVIPSFRQHRAQYGGQSKQIDDGVDGAKGLLVKFSDKDDQLRLKYDLKIVKGRPHSQWPAFKSVEEINVPMGTTLEQMCQHFPLHVWGHGLRIFIHEGKTAEWIWNAVPPKARNKGSKSRPWNYYQQAMGREVDRMREESGSAKRVPEKRKKAASSEDEDEENEFSTSEEEMTGSEGRAATTTPDRGRRSKRQRPNHLPAHHSTELMQEQFVHAIDQTWPSMTEKHSSYTYSSENAYSSTAEQNAPQESSMPVSQYPTETPSAYLWQGNNQNASPLFNDAGQGQDQFAPEVQTFEDDFGDLDALLQNYQPINDEVTAFEPDYQVQEELNNPDEVNKLKSRDWVPEVANAFNPYGTFRDSVTTAEEVDLDHVVTTGQFQPTHTTADTTSYSSVSQQPVAKDNDLDLSWGNQDFANDSDEQEF